MRLPCNCGNSILTYVSKSFLSFLQDRYAWCHSTCLASIPWKSLSHSRFQHISSRRVSHRYFCRPIRPQYYHSHNANGHNNPNHQCYCNTARPAGTATFRACQPISPFRWRASCTKCCWWARFALHDASRVPTRARTARIRSHIFARTSPPTNYCRCLFFEQAQ